MSIALTSKPTKAELRQLVARGASMPQWCFPFILKDRAFQAELISIAETHQNAKFFASLGKFLDDEYEDFLKATSATEASYAARRENRQYTENAKYCPKKSKRRKLRLKSQTIPLRCPNHSPTRESFEYFLESRGIYINPNYCPRPIRFVCGGAPGLGKRA